MNTKNTISSSKLSSDFQGAYRSGDKLARACYKGGGESAESLYALSKGYDAVFDKYSGYAMILNRRCLTVSNTYKNPNGRSSW